jgi:GntR family transcriptional regulator, transcriptional repressor for pyruvate dehydrogenase complex
LSGTVEMTDGQSVEAPGGRLAESVCRALMERITSGIYPNNTRLPTEREFAQEFEVSRPVVRSALARLRELGIIRSVQGSGSVVVGAGESIRKPGVTIRDLQRCFEFRLTVEGEAAFFAAKRATPSRLALIRQSLDVFEVARANRDFRMGQSFEFHKAVSLASDNDFFVEALASLSQFVAFRVYVGRSFKAPEEEERLTAANAEHEAIFRLIGQKQAEAAREAMRTHIETARDRFMECLPLGGA